MSKGLEALNEIENNIVYHADGRVETNEKIRYLLSKAKKELKALEIIKKKKVNVDTLSNCYFLWEYNKAMEYTYDEIADDFVLTQEEFDLLKEVLGND